MQKPAETIAKTTSWKLIVPFYGYAALAFLAAAVLMAFSGPAFTQHYFHPHTLAITHIMALGWGTMIILGASHQLVPVLTGKELWSDKLALLSFWLAAVGIPLLSGSFYFFNLGWPACSGALLVNAAVICYVVNLGCTIARGQKENVQAVFIFTAACWLLVTTIMGFLLLLNFRHPLLPADSLRYLPFHAHTGIVGWFLLLVIGVGSKLIPMFLISKYEHTKLLWWIYGLINGGLLAFLFLFLYRPGIEAGRLPLILVLLSLLLFGYYCIACYRKRIRKKVDRQVGLSLLSVAMTGLPVVVLIGIVGWAFSSPLHKKLALAYGFTIFFGWLTAVILGMTFKTLPFIIWNKVYLHRTASGKLPDPKQLFSHRLFTGMALAYLAGFLLFGAGILSAQLLLLRTGAGLLAGAAFLYVLNVFKIVTHQPTRA